MPMTLAALPCGHQKQVHQIMTESGVEVTVSLRRRFGNPVGWVVKTAEAEVLVEDWTLTWLEALEQTLGQLIPEKNAA